MGCRRHTCAMPPACQTAWHMLLLGCRQPAGLGAGRRPCGLLVVPCMRIASSRCSLLLGFAGKLLDWVLGGESALFQRGQLKALVSIHAEPEVRAHELCPAAALVAVGLAGAVPKGWRDAIPLLWLQHGWRSPPSH